MPRSFLVFLVCWIALGIGSSIFYFKASYQTKKTLHPFLMIAIGAIFLGFAEWTTQGHLPIVFVAVLIFIIFVNVRLTKFCPQCGATSYSRGFSRSKFCWKCGGALQ